MVFLQSQILIQLSGLTISRVNFGVKVWNMQHSNGENPPQQLTEQWDISDEWVNQFYLPAPIDFFLKLRMGQPSKQKLLKRRVGRLGGQEKEVTGDHISSGIAPSSAKLLWEKAWAFN